MKAFFLISVIFCLISQFQSQGTHYCVKAYLNKTISQSCPTNQSCCAYNYTYKNSTVVACYEKESPDDNICDQFSGYLSISSGTMNSCTCRSTIFRFNLLISALIFLGFILKC